jgi:hypothetical protein
MANRFRSYLIKNKRLILWGSILLILVSGGIVSHYQNSSNNRKLLKNAAFTNGQFTGEIEPYRKGTNGPWYICNYEVKGTSYKCYKPVHLCRKLGRVFFDQKFPIIYDSTNPESGRALVFPFEYKELNLKFPDSLNWILR